MSFTSDWWEIANPSLKVWNSLLLYPLQVAFNRFMVSIVLLQLVCVQVRLQTENLLGNLLVLFLDSLKLGLPLVEVQTPCLEFNRIDRAALRESRACILRQPRAVRLFTSRNFN